MSFGWLGIFRQGSWFALRRFVLQERRDLPRRVGVIRAELTRIGTITVLYNREVDSGTGEVRVTEQRRGFSVTANSSLERLVQAYIAQGGNPLDISHFFIPDRSVVVSEDTEGNTTLGDQYPYGGIVYPLTAEPNEPQNTFGVNPGGFLPLRKYIPGRIGGRRDLDSDAESFVNFVSALRRPVTQEIRTKLHDIEARIIKLMDLAEQLRLEIDNILTQSFGGVSTALTNFDEARYSLVLRVPTITDFLDSLFYVRDAVGFFDFDNINSEELAKQENLLEDILPDELYTTL